MTSPECALAFLSRDYLKLGMTRRGLDGSGLRALAQGVRSSESAMDLRAVCRALSLVLPPGAAFSHQTALALFRLPLPARLRDHFLPLHVTQPSEQAVVRRSDVLAHRGVESRLIDRVADVRVVSPADAWFDVSTSFALADLVVVADALLARRTDPQLLADVIMRRPRRRGIRAARAALALARAGSRSPQETQSRLMFMSFGLPEPVLNMDIFGSTGEWLACGDLVWRERRVMAEYQGKTHWEDGRAFARDRLKIRELQEEGWHVVELTFGDVHRTAARTARHVARRLDVPCLDSPMTLQELASLGTPPLSTSQFYTPERTPGVQDRDLGGEGRAESRSRW